MGVDLAALMGGLTGVGNLMGQKGNLGAQKMGMADSLFDWLRYFQRNSDPTINDLRNYQVGKFNNSPYGPYGDVEGAYGGMWGTREDGSPVQFGDMAMNQTNYMLNNNPVTAALAQLNSASGMTRPQGASLEDLMSGDASRAGGAPYVPAAAPAPVDPAARMTSPAAVNAMSPVMSSSVIEGVKPGTGPNPTISAPSPGVGTGVRQAISDLRAGETPALPSFGMGGGGGGGAMKPWMQFALRGIQNHGGFPALVGAMRGPGSALDNIGDFIRGNEQHGVPQQTNPWRVKGSYAKGTNYVPSTGTYQLHAGEAVVPAAQNTGAMVKTQPPAPVRQAPIRQFPVSAVGGNMSTPGTPAPVRMTSAAPVPVPMGPTARAMQGVSGGASGAVGADPAARTVPDPRSRLPITGGGASGGAGGGASGGMSSPPVTTPPVTTPPGPTTDLNGQRVGLVQGLLSAPESMSQAWQDTANKQAADARDLMLQDQQRQIAERAAASGLGDSGIASDQAFRAGLARDADLSTARTKIAQDAATTNFADRQNVARLALEQQLGVGDMALRARELSNQEFSQDRQYQTQLANLMMDLGVRGQEQQSNMIAQMGALMQNGLSFNDALAQLIYTQSNQRYADPGVSAVQQTGYAPNPYLDYMSSRNNSGGGGGGTDWFSAAMQGGAALAGLF